MELQQLQTNMYRRNKTVIKRKNEEASKSGKNQTKQNEIADHCEEKRLHFRLEHYVDLRSQTIHSNTAS